MLTILESMLRMWTQLNYKRMRFIRNYGTIVLFESEKWGVVLAIRRRLFNSEIAYFYLSILLTNKSFRRVIKTKLY